VRTDDLLRRLKRERVTVLGAKELSDLLEAADVIRERETRISGPIRVLRVGEHVLVQERTSATGDVVVRELASEEKAERFVEQRMADYDRMWDGCGCKIDYYE
jgi:hypothetical protein